MANTATSIYSSVNSAYVQSSETFTFTGDFTVEFWFYGESYENGNYTFLYELGDHTTSSSPYGCALGVYQDKLYHYGQTNSGIASYNTNYTIPGGDAPTGRWDHFAHVYSGGKFSLYMNGVLRGVTGTSTIKTYSGALRFGDATYIANEGHVGYYDEIRASKVARYGNFKTPTAPLDVKQTASIGVNTLKPENVTVLLQSDNSVANGTNVVGSTVNKGSGGGTIANSNGTSKIVTTEHLPWKNTSFFVNGKVDRWYLETGTDPEPFASFGYDDFSIEGWFKNSAPTGSGYNMPLRATYNGGPSSNWYINLAGGPGAASKTHFYYYSPAAVSVTEETRHDAGDFSEWTHFAIVREKSTISMFSNGRLVAANTSHGGNDASHTGGTDYRLQFNFDHTDTNVNDAGTVYVDDVRICKGVSAYTANFNPYGGQKNVVHNRGGALTDNRHASANTHAIQMGRAAIGSGTGANFASNANTYCFDFDGTADYFIHYIPSYRSSDDRGTIFMWIYPDNVDSDDRIFCVSKHDGTNTSANYHWFHLGLNSGALTLMKRNTDSDIANVAAGTVSASGWHSVAVVSDGTGYDFYIDGVASSITSGTDNGDWITDYEASGSFNCISIGALDWAGGAGNYFDGKIMQVAYFGSDGTNGASSGVLTAAQIAALHSAGKGHDLTTATGVYTATEIDDLHGYWRMGNHYLDTPRVIYDASGDGYTMQEVSDPITYIYDTGTTFHEGWQHRGYFDSDRYTSLLIQSSNHEGSTSFVDRGPGFSRIRFDGTDDVAIVSSLGSYRSSDSQGSLNLWVKPQGSGAFQTMLLVTDSASTSYYLNFRISSGNKLQLIVQWDGSNSVVFEQSGTVSFGAWHMYTITCDDNGYKLYIDGSEDTSAVMTTEYGDNNWWFNDFTSTKANRISLGAGAYDSTMHYFEGQMSQVGIWGGSSGTTGVLSASEISAIYALGPDGNVKTDYSTGLVDYWTFGNQIGEGTDTASTIYSQVAGGNDLTTSGTMAAPVVQHSLTHAGTALNHSTVASVYGGSSLHFDGTAVKSLVAADSPDWKLGGDSDWTLECWTKPESTSGNQCWLSHGDGTSPRTGWYWAFYGTSGGTAHERKIAFDYYNSGTAEVQNNTSPGIINFNVWQHVAVTYTSSSNTYSHFHDGILVHEFTDNSTVTESTGELKIGTNTQGSPAGTEDPFKGYIDEIRISSGVARYSKSIERFANTFVAKGDTGDAFTQLLLQSNGIRNGGSVSKNVNFSGTLLDSGTPYSTIGNPTWLNRVGDGFGGANTALFFDGTSALKFDDHAVLDYGTKDFTWEAWFNLQGAQDGMIIGQAASPWNDNFRNLYYDTSENSVYFAYEYHDGSTKYGYVYNPVNSKTYINLDKWYHVAVVNKPSARLSEMYINGALECANTASGTYNTASSGNPPGAGNFYIGATEVSGTRSSYFYGFLDQVRISNVARYGGIQLRTTQQTHVSANADSGVVTSNSTFGSGDNIFSTDGNTGLLLNADELYSNTHVSGSDNVFLMSVGDTNVSNVTTTFAITVGTGVRRDGTSGNVYYFNEFGRAPLTLVRGNHYIFKGATSVISSGTGAHPLKFSTTAGGTHSPGGTAYTTGITEEISGTDTLYKISPTSATPDSLHYYCSSHNNMGHTISVTDSTGSDGIVAPQPIGVHKGDKSTASRMPAQRQGISAYGANSFHFDGDSYLRTANNADLFVPHSDGVNRDYTMEIWMNMAASTGTWTGIMSLAGYHGGGDGLSIYTYGQTLRPYLQVSGASTNFGDLAVIQLNQWTHIAIQYIAGSGITGTYEVFLNGKKIHARSYTGLMDDTADPYISMGAHTETAAGTYHYNGFLDGIRYSKGIARYKYSGTNAKLGTNAVHHSQAKLLITSNTFTGNTHFDDFSDQGNYWNAQPTSIWSDGYVYAAGGTNTAGTNYFHTGYRVDNRTDKTLSYWVFPEYLSGTSDKYHLVGAQEGSAQFYLGFRGDGRVYTYIGASGEIMGADDDIISGQWHLLTLVQDGTDISAYVNGEVKATASSVGAGNDGTVNFGLNSVASGKYKVPGRISQLAIWEGKSLSAAEVLANWQLGPDANWMEDTGPTTYADKLAAYYTMGNHNNLGGRPADTTSQIYDRSGNGLDSTAGATTSINKGTSIAGGTTSRHSTDVSNFGSSAIKFDGTTGSALKLPQNTFSAIAANEEFTFEAWCFRVGASNATVFDSRASGTTYLQIGDAGGIPFVWQSSGNFGGTGPYAVDSSVGNMSGRGWFHYVVQRQNNQIQMLINGKMVISFERTAEITTAGNYAWIGAYGTTSATGEVWNGYLDELAFYKGAAKYNPVATGLGTATVTPSYLPDPTGNHFTPSGVAITDQMLDSPENNFCTLNVLKKGPDFTFSEGNLAAALGGSNKHGHCQSTFAVRRGKWYWEAKITSASPDSQGIGINGVDNISDVNTGHQLSQADAYTTSNSYSYFVDGSKYVKNTQTASWGDTFTAAGSVIGVAMDFSGATGKLDFYKDGSLQGGTDDPSGFHSNDIPLDVDYTPAISLYTGDSWHVNFGQGDPDGENNFTDSNGIGGFRYEPPQGYNALCTANLKDVDFAPIGPNSAVGAPDKHFDTLLWQGDSNVGPRNIGGLNFRPDLVWTKVRDASYSHELHDIIRGGDKVLYADINAAEDNAAANVDYLDFNDNGIDVGYHSSWKGKNESGKEYVAWCWKAGNETVVDGSGTIAVTRSTNVDTGFSIISYAKNATAGATIAHGLGKAPEWIMVKDRIGANDWQCYHSHSHATPEDNYVSLNQTIAATDSNTRWNDTAPDANFITLGASGHVNGPDGPDYIAYAWTSIEGFSKFGSYKGNASADGPFVYLGFRPAIIIFKNVSASGQNWEIFDNKRPGYNPNNLRLYPNDNAAEPTASARVDFLSNGFKIRTSGGTHVNGDGNTIIYMAWAEMPFKYANAR